MINSSGAQLVPGAELLIARYKTDLPEGLLSGIIQARMMDSNLLSVLGQAVSDGKLLASSLENIQLLLAGTQDPVASAAISDLVTRGEWVELNNRFYKTLAFGTGGLRGRTIGTVVVPAEQGKGELMVAQSFPV